VGSPRKKLTDLCGITDEVVVGLRGQDETSWEVVAGVVFDLCEADPRVAEPHCEETVAAVMDETWKFAAEHTSAKPEDILRVINATIGRLANANPQKVKREHRQKHITNLRGITERVLVGLRANEEPHTSLVASVIADLCRANRWVAAGHSEDLAHTVYLETLDHAKAEPHAEPRDILRFIKTAINKHAKRIPRDAESSLLATADTRWLPNRAFPRPRNTSCSSAS
jgi:hypothetical protein